MNDDGVPHDQAMELFRRVWQERSFDLYRYLLQKRHAGVSDVQLAKILNTYIWRTAKPRLVYSAADNDATGGDAIDLEPSKAQMRQSIQCVLNRLPPEQQCLLILRSRDLLSVDDIAARLQVSRVMVHSTLLEAKCRFNQLHWHEESNVEEGDKGDRAEEALVVRQAAEWSLLLEEGGLPDLHTEFLDWLLRSSLRNEIFFQLNANNESLADIDPHRTLQLDLPATAAALRSLEPQESPAALPPAKHRPKWQWVAAAGVASIAVALGAFQWQRAQDPWKHYTTAVGEQRTVELEDGSVLYLSPSSQVDAHFIASERQLRLQAGEAMFKVKHDASRPFRVHSDRSVVQAIGTRFSINRVRGEAVVSVIEGVVQVTREQTLLETVTAPITTSRAKAVRLAAGQEVRLTREGEALTPTRTTVNRVQDWRDRRLTFQNDSLYAIAAELNRYNEKPKIRIEDALAGETRYALLAIDADDPESLKDVLTGYPQLSVEEIAGEIIVRTREKAAP